MRENEAGRSGKPRRRPVMFRENKGEECFRQGRNKAV
jgi:hypothetical protein